MNSLIRKSLPVALVIVGGALYPQVASASSLYNGGVDFSYTITASNRNASGNLQSLSVSDAFMPDASGASATSTWVPGHQPYAGLGVARNVSLQAQDSVQLGLAISEYFSELMISFENVSLDINDIFDVNIDFNYTVTAQSGGEFADADATLSYSNEDYSFNNAVYTHASVADGFAQNFGLDSFGFVLSAGQTENFYFDSTVSGQIQATVVPVPAAIWLFGGGLAGLLGTQRKTAAKSTTG